MSISNFAISPFTQNRQSNTACGLQNISSGLNFNVSCLTSGDPDTCGFCIQGGQNGGLLTGALDVMRLWIDDLATTSAFNIRPTLDLNLSPATKIINVNDTMILNNPSINNKTTIQPAGIEVRDTVNDPFDDPIYVGIIPQGIIMRNGNGSNQTSSMTTSAINFTNSDTGFINNITESNITIQNTSTSDILTINNSGLSSTSGMLLSVGTGDIALITSNLTNIQLNAPNINSYNCAMPICFTGSVIGDNFNYGSGGQNFENVYNLSYGIPYQFISDSPPSGYTSNIWKIDFALNCYDCSNTGDKGIALYIQFQDVNSNIYTPLTYNLDTPYAIWQNPSQFHGIHSNFQNFNWSDYVDFSPMAGSGSGNVPLTMLLYWAGDGATNNKFNITVTLTRTNLL